LVSAENKTALSAVLAENENEIEYTPLNL